MTTIPIAVLIAVLVVLAVFNYYLFKKVANAAHAVKEIAEKVSAAAKPSPPIVTPIVYNPQICSICHRIVVKHVPDGEGGFICATCYTRKKKA